MQHGYTCMRANFNIESCTNNTCQELTVCAVMQCESTIVALCLVVAYSPLQQWLAGRRRKQEACGVI